MQSSAPVRLSCSDYDEAARVVTVAFMDYTYMKYIATQAHHRARVAKWFGASSIRYGLRYGRVDTTVDLRGMAVWLPPGQTDLTAWRLLRSGYLSAPRHVSIQGLVRFIQSSHHMEHAHRRFAPGRHWYLFALAVDPQYQGQGIGGQLLQPVLALADAESMPCYLETQTERNTRFYQRHGFQIMSQAVMPGSDMTIYAMLRAPRPLSA